MPKQNHRTFRVQVILSEEEKARVHAAAQSRGQTDSAYLRGLALDAATAYEAGK
jgi:hypothetical protein